MQCCQIILSVKKRLDIVGDGCDNSVNDVHYSIRGMLVCLHQPCTVYSYNLQKAVVLTDIIFTHLLYVNDVIHLKPANLWDIVLHIQMFLIIHQWKNSFSISSWHRPILQCNVK